MNDACSFHFAWTPSCPACRRSQDSEWWKAAPSESGLTDEEKIVRRTDRLASAAHNLRLLGVEVEVKIKRTVEVSL